MASFGIILTNSIINKLYKKQTEGIKFCLKVRITHIIISRRIRGGGSFPLVSRLFNDPCLRPGWSFRFIRFLLWELLTPKRIVTLRQQILVSVISKYNSIRTSEKGIQTYSWQFID